MAFFWFSDWWLSKERRKEIAGAGCLTRGIFLRLADLAERAFMALFGPVEFRRDASVKGTKTEVSKVVIRLTGNSPARFRPASLLAQLSSLGSNDWTSPAKEAFLFR